ncbi:hypothetical protein SRHO_G00161900 [Serrasalmus rhombeus]
MTSGKGSSSPRGTELFKTLVESVPTVGLHFPECPGSSSPGYMSTVRRNQETISQAGKALSCKTSRTEMFLSDADAVCG